MKPVLEDAGVCRMCGCSEYDACLDPATGLPCHWVEADLCSACAPEGPRQNAEPPPVRIVEIPPAGDPFAAFAPEEQRRFAHPTSPAERCGSHRLASQLRPEGRA